VGEIPIIGQPLPQNVAPTIIVKHRDRAGTVVHSDRISRFWKSKQTGDTVEVKQYQRVVPDNTRRVVYFDPGIGRNLSCSLQEFMRDFEDCGNTSMKF
jgi:hypothetical protein